MQLAARAGLADRVIFLGGKEDIRPLYAAADCFILPTRYDPFPNAALEALAMGLPVIVSSRCGAAELVKPGVNGWIWEPDSARELGRMMTAAAAAVDEPMGGAARATAEEFGVERMAQRMVGLYESLLGRAAARAHGGN